MKYFILIMIIILLSTFLIYEKSFEQEDVNRDGTVNAQDLLLVQKYILKKGEKNEKST